MQRMASVITSATVFVSTTNAASASSTRWPLSNPTGFAISAQV